MPVALVEVGFINNPQERAQMLSEDYQQKAAQGVFRAIKRSIGELEKLKKK